MQFKLNFTSILDDYSPLGMVNDVDYFFTLSSCKQTTQQQILSFRRVSTTAHVRCPSWKCHGTGRAITFEAYVCDFGALIGA